MDQDLKDLLYVFKWILLGTVTLVLLSFVGCYGCSRVHVSDGYRDGVVRKVSYTGYVWKTWEVEMVGDVRLQSGKDGQFAAADRFTYSVSDPAVVEQLKVLPPDTRVRVQYRKQGAAWGPNGETSYFITAVEVLPPPK